MRQEFLDATGRLSRQSFEYVFEIAIRIVAIELGGLDQAHDHGRTASCAQRAGEQPVGSSQRDRADSVLDPVVVDG